VFFYVEPAELVQQVRRVTQALGKAGLPVGVTAITGGHKYKSQRDRLAEGTDLVIATPGRLIQHLRDGNIGLGSCVAAVVDEVDVLLAEGAAFRQDVSERGEFKRSAQYKTVQPNNR
jgi:superfamily II DNA/RNA helicase